MTVDDFSETENDLFNNSFEMLRLMHKPTGQRRSLNGLNRAAQLRFPEMNWEIDDVMCIATTWRIAGVQSLIDAIRAARKLRKYSVRVASVSPKLIEFASMKVADADNGEAFVALESFLNKPPADSISWHLYRVAARTNYGQYRFNLLSFSPPSLFDVEHYCIAHTVANAAAASAVS